MQDQLPKVWTECVDSLKQIVSETKINLWIHSLQAELADNCLTLLAPNQIYHDHVQKHFLELIKELVSAISKNTITIKLQIKTNDLKLKPDNTSHKQLIKAKKSPFKKEYTFKNLVIGNANQLAIEIAIKIANTPLNLEYNPFFIYGSSGLGKTHLMHAIANTILEKFKDIKIAYIESQNFVKSFISALKNKKIDQFSEYYQSLDVLLIDDIHFFAHKGGSQQELFYTFNSLFNAKSQIILSADQFPREINGLEDRLKTRFGAGLTVSIKPPELEMRMTILKEKAKQKKIKISDDATLLIAKNVQSSIRDLEGIINRLQAYQKIKKELIDINYVKKTIGDLLSTYTNLVTIEKIQQVVCQYFQLSLKEILSSSRSKKIVRTRQIAMFLCRELTNKSLPEISVSFGKKDHTTVLYACRKIETIKNNNQEFILDHITKIKQILS